MQLANQLYIHIKYPEVKGIREKNLEKKPMEKKSKYLF